MGRSVRRLLIVVAVLAVLIGAFFFYLYQPEPPTVMPNPNGYDDFVAAGETIVGTPGDGPSMDLSELQSLIATNTESLRRVRAGLTKQCSAPTEEIIRNFNGGQLTKLADLKGLAQLLAAEGRMASLEGRNADAALIYTEVIRYGNEASRGGVLISRLVGLAIEAIGYAGLLKVLPSLDCEQSRPIIASLQQLDDSRIDWAEIRKNENRFARYELRKRANPVTLAVTWWQNFSVVKRTRQKHDTAVAKTRLLLVELSLRCFVSAHGQPPQSLSELQDLKHIPTDPFTDQPFAYRPQGTNWLLYSIGSDGVDDRGKPAPRPTGGKPAKGDVLFNSP